LREEIRIPSNIGGAGFNAFPINQEMNSKTVANEAPNSTAGPVVKNAPRAAVKEFAITLTIVTLTLVLSFAFIT
jgi:hypothetical protein